MATPSQELPLAAEFSPASREQWRKLVDDVLKGASFEDTLVSETYDGLRIEPLYERSQARPIAGRQPGRAWQVLQRVDHPEPAAANAQALEDLENGATGLFLVLADAAGSHGYGLDVSSAAIERALAGVHLDAGIAIELELGLDAEEAARSVASLVKTRGTSAAAANIRFGLDPLGGLAVNGRSPLPWPETAPRFAAGVAALAEQGFKGPFVVADARAVHAAGGSEAQELGFALSHGLAYLRALEAFGMALEDARGMIFFRLAADADQFLTMAKFRAIRKLWARVEAVCGLAPKPTFVCAETAWRMMTRRDPHVNILRTTIAAFAAGLGGADAITVQPFTLALGLPDRFARSIARSTQLILLEEANLAKVADPAAGSGAIEDVTDQLCRAAWGQFQRVETAGGPVAALAKGLIQGGVERVRAERQSAVAHRLEPITGTTEFAVLEEAPVSVLDVPPVASRQPKGPVTVDALLPSRLAEPFEALRDASDRVLVATGSRPKVFLATLGEPADFMARVDFAKNFFAAGGIETVAQNGFAALKADLAALVAAFKASDAKLACLCASDAVYGREAPAAARALAGAGAVEIYLAGRPAALAEPDKAGIARFIHAGCNALAILKATHDILSDETVGKTP
ncbi:MAG: methylmalonyl-CoA mutase family protein [Xanthobacteraceae bacterium]